MLCHDDLILIAAIARHRRIRPAAEALHSHPATLYRRLEALEAKLAQPLFERIDGLHVATSLGEEVLRHGDAISARFDALNRTMVSLDGRLMGTLTLTTTDTLLSLVMPLLPEFAQEHPLIRLELKIANGFADLGRNEADIAIRPTLAPPETLVGQRVGAFEYCTYTGGAAEPGEIAALLESQRWVILSGAIAQIPVARWLKEHVPDGHRDVAVDSLVAAALAARAGLCAVLPSYLGDDPLFGLKRISGPVAGLRSDVWLLTHADMRNAARVRAFMRSASRVLRTALNG